MRRFGLIPLHALLPALLLWANSAWPQQRVLDIEPVFQNTPVYCWLATGQMVFQYFGIPENDPASDYQCGEAKGIHAFPTNFPEGPNAYTGFCWNNCHLAQCMMTAGGSIQGIYNLVTQYPQIVARTNGNTTLFTHPQIATSALSPAQVVSEINSGRPIIAGISPGAQYLPPGISEHAVLIVGYDDGGATLVVNDPFPYDAAHMPASYVQYGGHEIEVGRYEVSWQAMVGPIAWKNTIYDLQTNAPNTATTQHSGGAGLPHPHPHPPALSCTVDATAFPWNPPGVAQVSVDGYQAGSFSFGPGGSTALNFPCQAGHHQFRFSVVGTPISCSGTFDVDQDDTDFSPLIQVSPFGRVSCSLQ